MKIKRLEDENYRLHLVIAILEHSKKPSRRGRKPKFKPLVAAKPKGRPRKMSKETLMLLPPIVEKTKTKTKYSIKTDREALIHILVNNFGYSQWRAKKEVQKLQIQLSKARNIKKNNG